MNKARNLVEMGEFYASTVLTEAKKNFPPKDTFATPGKKTSDVVLPKGLKTKAYDMRGPLSNENGKSLAEPLEAKNAKGKKTFSKVEDFSSAHEKMEVEPINNSMNKSIFDRLYEEVINDNTTSPEAADQHDAEALDLPSTEEGGDEVTITLSKELAQKLHDAIKAVIGSDEEQTSSDEDLNVDGEDAEEAHVDGCKCNDCKQKKEQQTMIGMEATELETLGVAGSVEKGGKHPYELGGAGNNKVKDSWSSHNVDGSEGEGEIKNQNQPSPKKEKLTGPTPVKGTANYVASLQGGERTKKNVGKVVFTK